MAEKFKSFYIDRVPRQQTAHAHALASLAASLALSARAKEKYSSIAVTYTAQNSPLKTLKPWKIFKLKRFLRLQ